MTYSPDYIRGWLAGFEANETGRRWLDYLAGWEDRARLEHEASEAEWQAVRDVVARTAGSPSWLEMCRRRGDVARGRRAEVQARRLGVGA